MAQNTAPTVGTGYEDPDVEKYKGYAENSREQADRLGSVAARLEEEGSIDNSAHDELDRLGLSELRRTDPKAIRAEQMVREGASNIFAGKVDAITPGVYAGVTLDPVVVQQGQAAARQAGDQSFQ